MEAPSYPIPPPAKVDRLHFKECLVELLQVGTLSLGISPYIYFSLYLFQTLSFSLRSEQCCYFFPATPPFPLQPIPPPPDCILSEIFVKKICMNDYDVGDVW